MKRIIIGLLILVSFSSFAKESRRVSLNCEGKIRYGAFLSDAILVPLDVLLQEKLATNLIEVSSNNKNVDAQIGCTYKFNADTFYSLRHEAEMTIIAKLTKNQKEVIQSFSCAATVNDGGHQTLKKSCVTKLAKKIRVLLDDNL